MSVEAFKDYLKLEKNYSSHTINAYLRDINAFKMFLLKKNSLSSIDYVEYPLCLLYTSDAADD